LPRFKYLLIILLAYAISGAAYAQVVDLEDRMAEMENARKNRPLSSVNSSALDGSVNPDRYVVGPGDELTIVFSGKIVNRHLLTVTPEGSLLVPEFGAIKVSSMSLSDAKDEVITALRSRYRNVPISVFLTGVRRIKVSVAGEVEFPGIYELSAADRVSDAISMTGEPVQDASRRNIRLIRSDSVHVVDLMGHLRAGRRDMNPYLIEGDVIVVPETDVDLYRVGIYGAVQSPDEFEYSPYDNLGAILMLAYGLSSDADSSRCEIVRFRNDLTTYTMNVSLPTGASWLDSLRAIKLMPDDRVYFRKKPFYHRTAQVRLLGEVVYPGWYPIIEDTTRLSDIIAKAGGFTLEASLVEATMDRRGFDAIKDSDLEKRLKLSANELNDVEMQYLKYQSADRPGRVSIDLNRLFVNADSTHDLTLKDGDVITVPKMSNTVRVIGNVLRPGLIEYASGMDYKFYIDKSGGFGWKANKRKVRIVKSSSGAIVNPSRKIPIEVGDAIVVPEKLDTDWWGIVKDVGLFLANLATVYIVVDQILE